MAGNYRTGFEAKLPLDKGFIICYFNYEPTKSTELLKTSNYLVELTLRIVSQKFP